MPDYISSEELQRHNADVFARDKAKKVEVDVTDRQKLAKAIDKYIGDHSSTVSVRNMAVENKKSADYQLDLSADIVIILSKIKSDLGLK